MCNASVVALDQIALLAARNRANKTEVGCGPLLILQASGSGGALFACSALPLQQANFHSLVSPSHLISYAAPKAHTGLRVLLCVRTPSTLVQRIRLLQKNTIRLFQKWLELYLIYRFFTEIQFFAVTCCKSTVYLFYKFS